MMPVYRTAYQWRAFPFYRTTDGFGRRIPRFVWRKERKVEFRVGKTTYIYASDNSKYPSEHTPVWRPIYDGIVQLALLWAGRSEWR